VRRPAGALLMAAVARGSGRLVPSLRRAVGPIAEARGFARAMLWVGAGLTGFFVVLAIFAPLISPYAFDQYSGAHGRFPQLAGPSSRHLFGTTVQAAGVLSRIVWGERTELEVVGLGLVLSLTVGGALGLMSG